MLLKKVLSVVISMGLIGVSNVRGDESTGRLREKNWGGEWYILAYDSNYSVQSWPYCPSMSLYEFQQEKKLPNADYCVYVNQTEHVDYLNLTWPYPNAITKYKVTSRVILENECYDWEMNNNDKLLGHIFVSRNPSLLKEYPELLVDREIRYADCPPKPDAMETTEALYYDQ